MKQKLLNLTRLRSLLLLVCVMLGVSAWGAEETFSYTAYSSQGTSGSGSACSATQNVITIASTKGYFAASDGHVREYAGSDITISGATITKIEITCTASGTSNYGPSKIGLPTNAAGNYSYSGNVGTWTGSATSVTLHANAQARWTQIKVTYTPNAGPTYTVTLGDDNTTLTELGYGAGVSLPTRDDLGVFMFQGWSVSNLTSETTEAPTNIFTGQYNPTANITLYPIYKRTESIGGPATTASVSIADYALANNWANGTKYEMLIIDDKLTASISGGGNTGKYYSSDKSWRIYGSESGTLTITSTEGELNSVTFNYKNDTFKYGDITLTSGEAVNVSGTSATFTASGSAIQITSISVVYGGGTTTYYYTSNPIIPVHSAHFFVNCVEASSDDYAEGANIDFPEAPEDINGKTFMGWTTEVIDSPTNTKPTLVTSATMGEEDVNYYAVFATRTVGAEQNVSMTINSETQNIPTSYAASQNYTLNGNVFNITQMYKNGTTLQWRAAGNSNGTGTMYNEDAIHNIRSIVITYTNSDTNKNFTVKVGASKNPTEGTSINSTTNELVSTFDCSTNPCDYFVLTNGSGAGYLASIVINYTQIGPDTYSGYCTTIPNSTPTITLASACTDGTKYYGTYSNSNAFAIPEGLTVSEIGINEDGTLNVQNYAAGAIVPANTGVMVSSATPGDHTVTLTSGGTSVLGINNRLFASGDAVITSDAMATAAPNCKYYRLTMHNGTKLGFYWGAPEGVSFDLAANKAYLAIPIGNSRSGFNIGGEESGIEAVITTNDDCNVYDLQGRRVAQPQKGLYIVNGKKVIIK